MNQESNIRNRNGFATPVVSGIVSIERNDAAYPGPLGTYLKEHSPGRIYTRGNLDILRRNTLALFCSVKCPGDLILKTYDLARDLRDAGIVIVSGFHSPMEKECLSLLLRGNQPVVWCLARRLAAQRVPREYIKPLSEGRLLILSPFGKNVERATTETALFRNTFVAALADGAFVAYAVPGGKTEVFCRSVLEWRKPLFTFDCKDNAALLAMGARPYNGASSIAALRPALESCFKSG